MTPAPLPESLAGYRAELARIAAVLMSDADRDHAAFTAAIALGHATFALNPLFDGGFGNPRRPVSGPAPDVAAGHLTAAAAALPPGRTAARLSELACSLTTWQQPAEDHPATSRTARRDVMTAGPYGARERAKLAHLDEGLRASASSDLAGVAGTVIADMLRQQLPDMDDVTIGRVVIALTVEGIVAIAANEDRQLQNLWAALVGAGLHLTETAWKTPEAPRE